MGSIVFENVYFGILHMLKMLNLGISGIFNFEIIGIRPGEKIHEELINPAESRNTVEFKNYYSILSNLSTEQVRNYCKKNNCKIVPKGFSYNSGTNKSFMSDFESELIPLIKYRLPLL